MSRDGQNVEAPPGCHYHEVDELMDETLRHVDRDLMPVLRRKVAEMESSKTVIRIDDPSAWDASLDSLCGPFSQPSGSRHD